MAHHMMWVQRPHDGPQAELQQTKKLYLTHLFLYIIDLLHVSVEQQQELQKEFDFFFFEIKVSLLPMIFRVT